MTKQKRIEELERRIHAWHRKELERQHRTVLLEVSEVRSLSEFLEQHLKLDRP